jgi:hypothetical protein
LPKLVPSYVFCPRQAVSFISYRTKKKQPAFQSGYWALLLIERYYFKLQRGPSKDLSGIILVNKTFVAEIGTSSHKTATIFPLSLQHILGLYI